MIGLFNVAQKETSQKLTVRVRSHHFTGAKGCLSTRASRSMSLKVVLLVLVVLVVTLCEK